MSPERHLQIGELYHAVLALPPAERSAFLAQACKGDDALRTEVESLVSAHEQPATLLVKGALGATANLEVNDHVEFSVGQRIAHYEIIAPLGAGGMGEVYLADDKKMGRRVALKVLPGFFTQDPQRVRRFKQEAQAVVALNHPNIVTIYDVGQAGGIHFIATERIEGETIRQRAGNFRFKLSEIIEVAIQVTSALVAAHQAGVVHRDIKPENIMLRADGYVKVLDFGLAKLLEKSKEVSTDSAVPTLALVKTDAGVVMGTANYMSPEQARGADMDARTDIWSLGVVVYELATGRLPFEGATPTEALARIIEREPAPLARYAPELPAELDRIVSKALTKDRDERYQTAKDLLIDLKRLKQRLEVDSEIERVHGRDGFGSSTGGGSAQGELTSLPAEGNTNAYSTASAQYLVAGFKRHKLAAVVALVLVVAAGLWWYFQLRNTGVAIDSIAVMPFENVTHDQKLEYLSDGVTESLITSLSQLPNIRVIARSSVFSYKNQTPNLQQVAQKLNVRAVLTGRVLMQGDTLDVRVELTDTQNNTQLWGDHYIRKAADIFAVQDEIAQQVTDKLRVRLTGLQQEQVTKRYTDNEDAYRLYLQARYYMNEGSEESFNRAIPLFDQAIALDPRYALAYAARGECFFNMGDLSLPMKQAMLKARRDVSAALSIDDKLTEARSTLANITFQYDWDFAGADSEFKQVIAMNPNYAEAHHQYTYYLAMTGKPIEAVAEIKLAQQLDPVNPGIVADTMLPYFVARQYDQSIVQSRKALEMFPGFFLPHMALGGTLIEKGDYSGGIQELEKAETLEPTPLVIGNLGYAYAKSGRKDEARKLLAELKEQEQSKGRYVPPYWIAMIYVGLDEKDEAFAWLEKAYEQREWWLCWIKMDPKVDSLRSDSRFTDLMRRVGFPP